MTRLFWVAALFALATAAGISASSGIETTVTISRTRFLSGEIAKATISIFNGTGAPVSLDVGAVTISTNMGGGWQSRRNCMVNCWRVRPAPIAAGEHKDFQITLPRCEVLSDPCGEDVRLQYTIASGQESHQYDAPLPQLWFVPDPNATYRDVPDGSPVFVLFGSGKTTIVPNTVVIGVTTAPSASFDVASDSPPALEEATRMLKSYGLTFSGRGSETDNPRWYVPLLGDNGGSWRRQNGQQANALRWTFWVGDGAKELEKINAAMAAIRSRLGESISLVNARYEIKLEDNQELWSAAQGDADPRAQRLAALTGSGDTDWRSVGRTAPSFSMDNARPAQWNPNPETVFTSLQPMEPFEVKMRGEFSYAGTTPAKLRPRRRSRSLRSPRFVRFGPRRRSPRP